MGKAGVAPRVESHVDTRRSSGEVGLAEDTVETLAATTAPSVGDSRSAQVGVALGSGHSFSMAVPFASTLELGSGINLCLSFNLVLDRVRAEEALVADRRELRALLEGRVDMVKGRSWEEGWK